MASEGSQHSVTCDCAVNQSLSSLQRLPGSQASATGCVDYGTLAKSPLPHLARGPTCDVQSRLYTRFLLLHATCTGACTVQHRDTNCLQVDNVLTAGNRKQFPTKQFKPRLQHACARSQRKCLKTAHNSLVLLNPPLSCRLQR